MNREIKFRGQAINSGEWVYGLLRVFKNKSYERYFIVTELEIGGTEVKKVSVGQYTGLKDKNGVEIYEGDIIETKFFPHYVDRICWKGKPDATCEVYWDFSQWALKAKGDEDSRFPGLHEMNFRETEVIGNIYENPELLEQKSETAQK